MANSSDMQSSAFVEVAFDLRVEDGAIGFRVDVPAGQTNLTAILPILQNMENTLLRKVSDEATEAGHPISCRAGCGACCRQMVPVSIFEAEALCAWFRSLPEESRAAIEQRFHRSLLKLRDAGVLEQILSEEWIRTSEAVTRLAIDYFHAGVPCPFLIDESCSIHPIRPLVCREYLVTSPPERCSDPSVHKVAGVQLPFKLSHALYRMGQELEHDSRGWIPLVFLLAWNRSGMKPGEAYAGTGQEVLRSFVEHLATLPPAEGAMAGMIDVDAN